LNNRWFFLAHIGVGAGLNKHTTTHNKNYCYLRKDGLAKCAYCVCRYNCQHVVKE